MSYSFSNTAKTKEEVQQQTSDAIDQVATAQPVHEAEKEIVKEASAALLGLLPDDPEKHYHVSANGASTSNDAGIRSVNVNISVVVLAPSAA